MNTLDTAINNGYLQLLGWCQIVVNLSLTDALVPLIPTKNI
jgi:hypothetical protein